MNRRNFMGLVSAIGGAFVAAKVMPASEVTVPVIETDAGHMVEKPCLRCSDTGWVASLQMSGPPTTSREKLLVGVEKVVASPCPLCRTPVWNSVTERYEQRN